MIRNLSENLVPQSSYGVRIKPDFGTQESRSLKVVDNCLVLESGKDAAAYATALSSLPPRKGKPVVVSKEEVKIPFENGEVATLAYKIVNRRLGVGMYDIPSLNE